MNCPYCGGEMEKGYVKTSHPVVWSKNKRRKIFDTEDDVFLTDFGLFSSKNENSYLCRSCGKVIIDIPADD